MGPHHSDNSPVPVPLETRALENAPARGTPATTGVSTRSSYVCASPAVTRDNAPLRVPVSEAPAPPEHKLAEIEASQTRRDAGEPLPQTSSPSWLKPLATGILIVCAILGLMIMGQVSTILLALASLPTLLQYVAYTAVAAGLIALAWLLAKPLWAIARLRANPVTAIDGLRALIGLKKVQSAARSRELHDRDPIREHLLLYGRVESELEKYLESLGCCPENIKNSRLPWKRVVSEDAKAVTTDSFFERVDEWNGSLKRCADDIIGGYARSVALGTAVSPNPLIDSIIVVVSAVRMVGDLCKLYNRRIGGAGVTILTGYLCVQTYAARRGQDIGESVADTVKRAIGKPRSDEALYGVMETATNSFAELGVKVAGKIARVGVEAGVNYLLMRRLGRTVVQFLATS